MMRLHHVPGVATLALAGLLAAACGGGDAAPTTDDAVAETLAVPDDFDTIQKAVDAAGPGDLVLIEEGVYHESVVVQTDDVVIRGVDRNTVILDGELAEDMENGFIVLSDGVAIENLTVRNYRTNGLFWTGDYDADHFLRGYRASYVTVYGTGTYGIYAFNATDGQFERSHASGTDGSAFYVGQCNPCNALLHEVIGEYSGQGYSGTNSTGVTIAASEFRHNAIGLMPNSSDFEEMYPNQGTTIIGNHIHDNDSFIDDVPPDQRAGIGTGVVLGGTTANVVERNRIVDNPGGGVVVVDWTPTFGGDTAFEARDNVVRSNVVAGSTDGPDLLLATVEPADGARGTCFGDNTFTSSVPADIDTALACGRAPAAAPASLAATFGASELWWAEVDPRATPRPGPLPSMPDARTAPARPATDVPMTLDLDAVAVPPAS